MVGVMSCLICTSILEQVVRLGPLLRLAVTPEQVTAIVPQTAMEVVIAKVPAAHRELIAR